MPGARTNAFRKLNPQTGSDVPRPAKLSDPLNLFSSFDETILDHGFFDPWGYQWFMASARSTTTGGPPAQVINAHDGRSPDGGLSGKQALGQWAFGGELTGSERVVQRRR